MRGLEAQNSFRQKFALEFNDVTRALGSRSLLIFIDDLDRCRPDNVLETLEAVNFLTTSGECFVVIGMAREYVERCVGRAFKDFAEEMIDDLDDLSDQSQTAEDLAKEKRIEFARQYLDKLINIEVPVPTAKQPQSLNLLLAGAHLRQTTQQQTKYQEFKTWSKAAAQSYWRVATAGAVLASALIMGYLVARQLPTSLAPAIATANPTPTPTRIAASSPTPLSASVTPTPSPAYKPSPIPSPTPDLGERAEVFAGARGLFWKYSIPIALLLGLAWFGIAALDRRPGLVVKDSPAFVDALKIWHPLIYSRHSTPRGIKRFMNRVRYLAMRQRSKIDIPQSWFRRLLSSRRRQQPPSPKTETAIEPIPDQALVALAAIEYFNKSLFLARTADDDTWPPTEIRSPVTVTSAYASDLRSILLPARAEHEKRFHNFDVFKYRDRFLEMAASVEVR
jgi:hypothetical protein